MDENKPKMDHDGFTLTTKEGVRFLKGKKTSCYSQSVTYYDIDVPPGLDTVRFVEGNYQMKKAHRQFPDVKKLVLEENTGRLMIPNSMFPNVREVECHSSRYRSGSCLVNFNGVLYNTFCLRPGEEVNLEGVKSIASFAFTGCMSENVINDKEVTHAEPNAFTGSIFSMAPGELLTIGKVLVRWDKPEIEVSIPVSCVVQEGGPLLTHIILYDKDSRWAFAYTRQLDDSAVIDMRDESFHLSPSVKAETRSVNNLVVNYPDP